MQSNQNPIVFLMAICLVFFVSTAFFGSSVHYADVIQTNKFELVDDKGEVRASIRIEETGETVFRLMDANGEIRVKLGGSEDGSGIVLLDGNTNPGIHGLAKKQGSTLTLLDADGKRKQITP